MNRNPKFTDPHKVRRSTGETGVLLPGQPKTDDFPLPVRIGKDTLTPMPICLLYHQPKRRARRFYRVEIAMNLFSEVSVMREWGVAGRRGQSIVNIYGNLREASSAADQHRNRALRRGYDRAHHSA